MYSFDVRLPGGSPAPLTLEGKRQMQSSSGGIYPTLAPGEAISDLIPMLNQVYDMTLMGKYSVTVSREVLPSNGKAKPVEMKSNTITIVVQERDVAASSTSPATKSLSE